jgi:ATP-dependent RNA helicase DDX43
MKSTSGDFAYYYPHTNQQFYQPQPEMGFMFPIGSNMGMAPQAAQTQNSYSIPQYGMTPNPYAGVFSSAAQANNNMMPQNNNNSNAVDMTHFVASNTALSSADMSNGNTVSGNNIPSAPGRISTLSAPQQTQQLTHPQQATANMKGPHLPASDMNGGMYWPDPNAAAMHARMIGNPSQAPAPPNTGQPSMQNIHSMAPTSAGPHQAPNAGLNDLLLAAMISGRNPGGMSSLGSAGPSAPHISGPGNNPMFASNGNQPPSCNPIASSGVASQVGNVATANAMAALAAFGVPTGASLVSGTSPFDLTNSATSANSGGSTGYLQAPVTLSSNCNSMPTMMEPTESQQFRVAKRHCGRIIGKGGVRIRELEEKHQCKIQVHSQEPPVNGCISITVTGTSWSRSQCWASVQEIIRESERREQQQGAGLVNSNGVGATLDSSFTISHNQHSVAPLLAANELSTMGPPGTTFTTVGIPNNSLMGGPLDVTGSNMFDPTAANGFNTWPMSSVQGAQQASGASHPGHGAANHLNDFTALMNLAATGTGNPANNHFEADLVTQFGNMMLQQQQQQQQQRMQVNSNPYRNQNNSYYNSNQHQNIPTTSRRKGPTDPTQYPVLKNFYNEDPALAAMTPTQRKEMLLRQNNLHVCGVTQDPNKPYPYRIPNAVEDFVQAFRDYPDILECVMRQNFTKPTPIQCISWPVLMSGLDFIGVAQTGSGKTLAYLLPALIHLEGQTKPRPNRAGPSVLILAPTRELTQQIQAEVLRYPFRNVRCVAIYGGAHRARQITSLQQTHPEIIVSTPGRLNDLLNESKIDLSDVTYCVLDEADRMLDMGFEPQVVQILAPIRKDRQTVMTTATWSQPIDNLAQKYMQDPVRVNVGTLELNVCQDVHQLVEHVREEERWQWLYSFLMCQFQPSQHKALIFVSRKLDCSQLAQMLSQMPHMPPTTCIHGDMDQNGRDEALELLRSGQVRILVATDVASRGLDIHDITHVINFDAPKNAEEYIHRVGRTGRAGRVGVAITLLTENDSTVGRQIMSVMQQTTEGSSGTLSSGNFNGRSDSHNRRRGGGANNLQFRQQSTNPNSLAPVISMADGTSSTSTLISMNGCPSSVINTSPEEATNKHRNVIENNGLTSASTSSSTSNSLLNGTKLLNGANGTPGSSSTNSNGAAPVSSAEFGGVFDPSLV